MTDRAHAHGASGPSSVAWTAPVAVCAALAAALGYALAAVPNIELITLAVFVAGAVLGRLRGALVGLVGMGVYSGLGPFGSGLAIPTMFVGQVGAMALVGFVGGLMGRLWRERATAGRVAGAAAAGLVLTCVYQVAVISGYAAASPQFADGFLAALAANLFFPYVHILWNTVAFAVIVPLLVPRVRRIAALGGSAAFVALVVAVLAGSPCPAAAQDEVPEPRVGETTGTVVEMPEEAPGDAPGEAPADSLAPPPGLEPTEAPEEIPRAVELPGTLGFESWRHPLGARLAVDLGLGDAGEPTAALGARPVLRQVSSRWPGQHTALTRGGLPPALSTVSVAGRRAADWLTDGLGLLGAVATDGVVLIPSGSDLSHHSLLAAGVVSAAPGGPASGAGAGSGSASVLLHGGRRYAGTPFSRVGMASGDAGLRWRVIEFGSGLNGRGGVNGCYEGRDGRGPASGGEYARESFAASATLDLAGAWRAEVAGASFDASRGVPDAEGVARAVHDIGAGSADLVLTDGRTRLALFHTETRLADTRAGETLSAVSRRTGAVVDVPVALGPVRSVRAAATGATAGGDLLAYGVRALSVTGSLEGDVRVGTWNARFAAGATRQRDEIVPELSCLARRDRDGLGPWVSLDAGGRFPTALELAGVSRPVVGSDGLMVGGAGDLEPERAATVGAGWALRAGRLDAGVAAEVSRVLSPVVLENAAGALRPTSGDDATASMLSLWVAAADSSLGGVRLAAEAIGVDGEGPLNALAPVPQLAGDASVWVDRRFFKGTLDTRFTFSVAYESGLARGPWDGAVDDALWRTELRAEGAVGPARLLITVDDPLDTDSGGWPGYAFSEPRVTYAFIWDFWD